MNLEKYRKEVSNLSINDQKVRNLYLRELNLGKLQGPLTGNPTIDKPYLKFFDERILEKDYDVEKTAFQYGYDRRKHDLGAIGYNFLGKKVTYKEYYDLVYTIVKALKKIGIKKEEFVGVNSPNSIETFAFIDALSFIGAIPSIFDPRAKDEELLAYINEVNCTTILTMDSFSKNIEDIISKTNIKNVIVMDITNYMNLLLTTMLKLKNKNLKVNSSFITWKQLIEMGLKNNNEYSPNEYKTGDFFSIAHTSGTSKGMPKGTIITNENINTISEQYRHSPFVFQEGDSFISPTPIHLIYGLALKHTAHSIGIVNYIQPEYNPKMTANMVLKNKINHVGAGTADADAIKELLESKQKYDASHIKTLATGGGKYIQVSKNACMDVLKKHNCNINITEGYGLTENTGPAITNFPNAYREGSIGIPFPYTDVIIIDPDTQKEVNTCESGELLIHSPSTTIGYIDNKELEKEMFITIGNKKYLRTKDKVSMDENGFITFEGRFSNIIPLYTGENISPFPIEEVIKSHELVKDCIVVGIKDYNHMHGEVPCVNIVLNEGYSEEEENEIINELKRKCSEKLKEEYIPQFFAIVDRILVTKNGKVDYFETKKIMQKETTGQEKKYIKKIKK